MKDQTFLNRLENIRNNVYQEKHQAFTCKYLDNFIKYFEKLETEPTYDEIYCKIQEVKDLISILNPAFKEDIKVYKKLIKEFSSWQSKINFLQRIYNFKN